MLEFLDRIEAKGRREGYSEAYQTVTVNLFKKGMTADEIAEILDKDVETVKGWLADVSGRE